MAASLIGRTAIVTGAYGGIGYAIANRFAREGVSLVLLGRDEARLNTATERLEKEYSSSSEKRAVSIRNFVCDVSRNEDWQNLISTSPDVDILVNCAGVTQQSILPQTDPRTVENILDTNLRGAIWGCKFVGKHMIRTKKKGCIINVSSLLASKAVAGTSVYAASKAGLLGLTTSLVAEYGRFGIRVNAIVPGYIDTLMVHDLPRKEWERKIPLGRFGTVDEVADAAAFLARNEYANNCMLHLDGGLSAT